MTVVPVVIPINRLSTADMAQIGVAREPDICEGWVRGMLYFMIGYCVIV